MTQAHEYSVIGHSRVEIGRHLGTVAAALSSGAVLLVGSLLHLYERLEGASHVPPIIFWPLTAGVIFPTVHYLFNRYVWKWSQVISLLQMPDLNGEWLCGGKTLDADKNILREWEGSVEITQTWEKIWVHLKTQNSDSYSSSAALLREPNGTYRLVYNYQNIPKISTAEVSRHVGFAELVFSRDLKTAEGDYFNNKGRYTFGTVNLKRKK